MIKFTHYVTNDQTTVNKDTWIPPTYKLPSLDSIRPLCHEVASYHHDILERLRIKRIHYIPNLNIHGLVKSHTATNKIYRILKACKVYAFSTKYGLSFNPDMTLDELIENKGSYLDQKWEPISIGDSYLIIIERKHRLELLMTKNDGVNLFNLFPLKHRLDSIVNEDDIFKE